MKLSKIANNNITWATVEFYKDKVTVTMFTPPKYKTLKIYKNITIDLPVTELSINCVKHLGVKRYREFKNDKMYINIYNY